eukprot:1194920-Prorocentrum_minimum.AAC.4
MHQYVEKLHAAREAILRLSREHPDLLDARLFVSRGCDATGLRHHELQFGDKVKDEYLSDTERTLHRFKYLVDIEGDGCSGM